MPYSLLGVRRAFCVQPCSIWRSFWDAPFRVRRGESYVAPCAGLYTVLLTTVGLCLLLHVPVPARAQAQDTDSAQDTDPLSEARFTELKARLEQSVTRHLGQALPLPTPPTADAGPLRQFFAAPPGDQAPVADRRSAERAVLEARREEALHDYGLSLRGGYLENIEQGVLDDAQIFYKRRARLELEWDVLDGGYLDQRYEARELDNEIQQRAHEQRRERRDARYGRLQNRIIHLFNEQKIPLLERRLPVLKDLLDVVTELHQADYVPRKRVLELRSQRAQVALRLDNYRAYNRQFADVPLPSAPELPVVKLSATGLEAALGTPAPSDRLAALRTERRRLENQPLRDISLSPYLRYNAYHSPGAADQTLREYFSVGVSFAMPMTVLFESDAGVAEARRQQRETEAEQTAAEKRKEVFNHYYEYLYTLEQYVNFYEKKLRLRTQVRDMQTRQSLDDPGYSPLDLLARLNQLLSVQVELVDLRQKMYLKLVRLSTYFAEGTIPTLATPVDVPQLLTSPAQPEIQGRPDSASARASLPDRSDAANASPNAPPRSMRRSVYVWSDTFEDHDNDALLSYLRRNGIERVFLSLGGATDTEKARNFFRRAGEADVAVQLMIGSNVLVYPRNRDRLDTLVRAAQTLGAEGVHLDVEPHTFDDWDERRAFYLDRYVEMLRQARRLTREASLKLSVSLPVFYDEETLQTIFPLTDGVNLMAYQHDDVDYVVRKTAEERALNADKVRLALRPQDFDDPRALRSFMERFARLTPVAQFTLHDLAHLLSVEDGPFAAPGK